MRLILTIALCALTLAGCVAQWPSNKTGPRWQNAEGPYFAPYDPGGAGQNQSPATQPPPPAAASR